MRADSPSNTMPTSSHPRPSLTFHSPRVSKHRIRRWASALTVVLPVLLAVAGWILVRQAQGQASDDTASQTTSVREPEWRAAARDVDGARTALRALQDLETVPTAGLTYGEYTERIAAAKAQVEPYTESVGGLRDVKAEMRAALGLYAFAGAAWDAKIRRVYSEGRFAEDPRLRLCPAVLYAVEESRARPHLSRTLVREIAVIANVPSLWECAATRTETLAAHIPL